MLINEAEVLNAYRAIYREISSYRAPWQARGLKREIARYGAIALITAKYRGAGARLAHLSTRVNEDPTKPRVQGGPLRPLVLTPDD